MAIDLPSKSQLLSRKVNSGNDRVVVVIRPASVIAPVAKCVSIIPPSLSAVVTPSPGTTTTTFEKPLFFPRRVASISTRSSTVAADQPFKPVVHPAGATGIRRSKTLPGHSVTPSLLKHLHPRSASLAPSKAAAVESGHTRAKLVQAIERSKSRGVPPEAAVTAADKIINALAKPSPKVSTTVSRAGTPTQNPGKTSATDTAEIQAKIVQPPAFATTSVQPLIPKRSASKGQVVRSKSSKASTATNTTKMAMATPAPPATASAHTLGAGSGNASSSQEYLQNNGSLQAQSPPPPLPRQRTLKTSKSVDGLSRLRSHTANPSMQSATRQFQHLYLDNARSPSPALTQSQIDAYSYTTVPAAPSSSSQSHHTQQQPPSSSSSSSGIAESPYSFQENHPYHQGGHNRKPSGYNGGEDIYGGTIQSIQSEAPGVATTGGGSIYQGLNVPTTQIASRSTPKLTLFNTPPLSQSNYKDSKETRSFGGQPSSHISDHGSGDPKPKPKSTHLKPIPAPQNKEKEDEEHIERDQYGFKKESQWLSHQDFVIFETAYVPVMERRRQKWAIYMNDSHGELPARSAKLKRYIRKGIPPALRGDAWFVYSGAKDKCNANPGLYNRLVNQAKRQGQANEHAEVIERDLHRTFPENINFKSQVTTSAIDGSTQLNTDNVAAIQSLRRVLLAFSLHCPSIGYCQSLNYIAGMLLLFMEEEHAFWTLSVITQNFLPEGMYDVTMEGANIDQAVLMTLVMERLPHIWTKFSNGATHVELDEGAGLPTVTLVTSHWFLTLFINILPVESVLRVWDCFFYEGRKILFRMALTILKMHESEITKIDDPLEVFQVVQNIPKRLIDCHKLMETCFKRVGAFDLTTKDIDRRYNHFRTKRRLARAASTSSRGGGTGGGAGTSTARRP